MKLINIEIIYEFSLMDLDLELSSDLSPKEEHIKIHFLNNEFDRVEYDFDSPYSKFKWEMLALINQKIKELESQLKMEATMK